MFNKNGHLPPVFLIDAVPSKVNLEIALAPTVEDIASHNSATSQLPPVKLFALPGM
jgi:hypothetical protein